MQQMNLPYETIDTPIYREAWRDLIKSKSTGRVSYSEFLRRMNDRNMAIRKKEFEERSFVVTHPVVVNAIKETLRNAGNPGKNEQEKLHGRTNSCDSRGTISGRLFSCRGVIS